MKVNRLNGVVLVFVGVALLIVAIDISLSLNAPHPANTQVAGVQFGDTLIPTATAILLQNLFLTVGIALAILGAIIIVLGQSGRVKQPKRVERAICGDCGTSIPEDSQRCPECGTEFEA